MVCSLEGNTTGRIVFPDRDNYQTASGLRLGLTFPEIYAMQIRAVLEAAAL